MVRSIASFLVAIAVGISSVNASEIASTAAMSAERPAASTYTHWLHSAAIKDNFQLRVRLPQSYAANPTRKYPVVYLTDGDLMFDFVSGVYGYGELALTFGAPFNEHIIVGIGYGTNDSLTVANKRARDLTPTAMNPPAFPWETETGKAEPFMAFLQEQILPFIERKYRASSTERIYFGHSYGGLFGAYVMFKKPQLFDRYILSSPAFWWDNGVIFGIEQTFAQTHSQLDKSVYLSAGALEDPNAIINPTAMMAQELAKYRDLRLTSAVLEGDDHLFVPANAFSKGFRNVIAP